MVVLIPQLMITLKYHWLTARMARIIYPTSAHLMNTDAGSSLQNSFNMETARLVWLRWVCQFTALHYNLYRPRLISASFYK